MCGEHDPHRPSPASGDPLAPPDWTTVPLPPAHVLSHLTDAHCHSTDLDLSPADYDAVRLGGIASMATVVADQERVASLSRARGWGADDVAGSSSSVRVVACFELTAGYHPWFVHRYALRPTTKAEHYRAVLLPKPSPALSDLLDRLLPHLPEPVPLAPLVDKLRADISGSRAEGRTTMLGEVGLDGQARVRWPRGAEGVWREWRATQDRGKGEGQVGGSALKPALERETRHGTRHGTDDGDGDSGDGTANPQPRLEFNSPDASATTAAEGDDVGAPWQPLTPFRTSMAHQRAVLVAQLELAIELGVNVSLHSVSASGATVDVLSALVRTHGARFTARLNVDLHSCGGMSAQSLQHAQRAVPNLYASPSVLITARSGQAGDVVRAIGRDRVLVESDSHDVRLSTRLVWAATEWVARCKGWRLEGEGGGETDEWVMDRDEEDAYDAKGRRKVAPDADVWAVRQLERNWARFMRLVD